MGPLSEVVLVCMFVCIYVYMFVCMYVCMYVHNRFTTEEYELCTLRHMPLLVHFSSRTEDLEERR